MQMLQVVLMAALAAAAPEATPPVETLALDQIRPGMTGIGRTVFEGTKIEEFSVRIIGVMENVAPRQSMILAHLEGGPLAKTGVIAGMSGSPVYIEGKLIGAVAFGFPFSKETIAGITPIGEMIDATRTQTPRAASARFPTPFAASGGIKAPLDAETFMAALRRPVPALHPATAMVRGDVPPQVAGQSLAPLSLPLTFSGFDPSTFDWARGIFSAMGFSPVMGASASAKFPEALPDLAPGGAVALSLIEGDMDVSATGTITHIQDGRVYAFGHPFYNLGPTAFPMKKAWVYSVFPSLYQSWKISAAGEVVGTVEQDRMTAIAGRLDEKPRMIPVEVNLRTSRGNVRTFSFRMVDDELFTPVLAYVALASVLQSNERQFGTSTVKVQASVSMAGKKDVTVEDLFTEQQPATQAAALVAAPLAYLMTNDFERVTVDKLKVDVTSLETIQSATLERAWIERAGPIRPGSTVPLKVVLRTYRGEAVSETIPVLIPQNAPAGTYTLLVSDGQALTALEQREMRQAFVPKDLDQLIRAINSLRQSNHVYARLLRSDDGAIVRGEYLQSLPPSVMSVLGGSEQGTTVVPIRTAAVWDFEMPTDHAVRGSRVITLSVER